MSKKNKLEKRFKILALAIMGNERDFGHLNDKLDTLATVIDEEFSGAEKMLSIVEDEVIEISDKITDAIEI